MGNCAFLQNFHTRKPGEITVFYVVEVYESAEKHIPKLKMKRLKFILADFLKKCKMDFIKRIVTLVNAYKMYNISKSAS